MKLTIILLGFFIATSVTTISAQVGISTTPSSGVFHIDGAGDNSTSGNPTEAQQSNDVFISDTGKIGIGTTNPQNHLHIMSPDANKTNLRFTRITNATPETSGNISLLGVDDNGDVVSVHKLTPDGSLACVPSILLNRGTTSSASVSSSGAILTDLSDVTTFGSQNNISYNSANGQYTLQPGHTYKLEAAVAILATNNDNLTISFTLASNSTSLGHVARSTPATASSGYSDGDQGKAVTIISIPSEGNPETIVLRGSPSSSSVSYSPENSFVSIQQLNPCSSN